MKKAELPKNSSREVALLASISLLAITLRAVALSYRGSYLGWDETMYLTMGRNLLSGHGYHINGLPNITFPPLMPVIASSIWTITGSTRLAFALPTAVMGGLAVIPVYLLARRMTSRSAAVSASLIFCGMRPLLIMSPFCKYRALFYSGSEHVFIFCIAWAMLLFWKCWQERSPLNAALAGALTGVAFEVRQEALGLFAALTVWLAAAWLIRDRARIRTLLKSLALALLLFAAGAAPWFIYAKSVSGKCLLGPHLSHNMALREAFAKVYHSNDWTDFFAIHHALNEDGSDFESAYYGVADYHRNAFAANRSSSDLRDLFKGVHLSSLRLWTADLLFLFGPLIGLLAILGLLAPAWKDTLSRFLFAGALLSPAMMIAMTLLVLPRYSLYTAPVFALFAGAGLEIFFRKLSRKTAFFRRAPVAVALLLALAGAFSGIRFNRECRLSDDFQRKMEDVIPLVAAQIRAVAPQARVIMAHEPRIPFAAQAVWWPMPTANLEDLAAFARLKKVDLIVLKAGDANLRPFQYSQALSRDDLFEILSIENYLGIEVALLRPLPLIPSPVPSAPPSPSA